MKLINIKNAEGFSPRFIPKRFQVSHFWEYFSEKIDFGFCYMLHRLRVKYPSVIAVPNDGSLPVWVALAAHAAGDIIYTTLGDTAYPAFVCTVPGNSAGAAPTWPHRYGETIIDGGVTWQAYDRNILGIKSPRISIELFDVANNFLRQPEPVPVELFTTPGGENGFIYPAPQPVDAKLFNVNSSANSPMVSLPLNYLYKREETLFMKIAGQQQTASYTNPFTGAVTAITPTWNPSFIDILCEGYYVPDSALLLWKEREKIL